MRQMLFGTMLSLLFALAPAFGATQAVENHEAEADVLRLLHAVNQNEIHMGNLAKTNGESKTVRDYGDELAKDHTSMDGKVVGLAKAENIDVNVITPAVKQENEEGKRMYRRLTGLKGKAFDDQFTKDMAQAHRETIAKLKRDQAFLKGTRAGTLAMEMLPELEHHEHMAERIERKQGVKKTAE